MRLSARCATPAKIRPGRSLVNRSQQLTADWVTPQEAADYLGVSKQTVRAWCKGGRLVSSKLGYRTLRISAASIEKMLEAAKQ